MSKSTDSKLLDFIYTIVAFYIGGYVFGFLLVKLLHWLGLV